MPSPRLRVAEYVRIMTGGFSYLGWRRPSRSSINALYTAPPGAAASTHILPHSPSDAAHPSGGCLGEYLGNRGCNNAWKIELDLSKSRANLYNRDYSETTIDNAVLATLMSLSLELTCITGITARPLVATPRLPTDRGTYARHD